ncbi:MAG: bifunctional (p)ppGpp synthetase/guanosine-3',5'-bis(diphosphate) 3'-pyrophosphohydrolase [Pseudomonadota bacterium]|nr:bifunctional (p)ppGpp synthetase/guanosine-3',5'-bis(diphosphate) 3'-pyrophosphohydrolase [Pseudomonadota bacterium]
MALMRQYELVERVKSYDPTADEAALNRAYIFAMKMHSGQKRESGEPYFSHPVAVASILTEYKLDSATIITALLHDTVEDTPASYADIKELFGEDVAKLVQGLTKLSKVQIHSEASKQAENFQKLVLAISSDIRVLLIKLADRLHNMRTLHCCAKEEKRIRIARETMEIYVPLAERIGMQALKDELEDLAFQTLHPEAYESITSRLTFLAEKGEKEVGDVIEILKKDLAENNVTGEVSGRQKRPYSIWMKMQHKNVTMEQIFDIMAFRVIVDTVAECYQVLGIIHTKYNMIPGRYKDYISTPKANGYQSIHTGVLGPLNRRIELQIRTHDMHQVAEFGVAAHWEYKQGVHREGTQYRWIRDLLELLNHSSDPNEFLEHTKIAMYQDQVFCFSPKGDLIPLPKGATPIDFAYAVHSGVGDTCVGVKINGKISPLRTVLQNGDQVDILTAKNQTPSAEWERIAVTAKARACIRRFLRAQKRQQLIETGRNSIIAVAKEYNHPFSDKDLNGILDKGRFKTADDLLTAIGEGLISATDIFHKIHPELKLSLYQKTMSLFRKSPDKPMAPVDKKMPITGLFEGLSYGFAKCCHPVPGDPIVGIVTSGKGVTIHTQDCPTISQYADEPERWIDVGWNKDALPDSVLPVRIKVTLSDQPTSMPELMTVLAQQGAKLSNLTIQRRGGGWIDSIADIEVRNKDHLDTILQALRSSNPIASVSRVKAG